MPRKDQGWITFQTSEEERQLLETVCQMSQRTKTEVLREMLRGLKYSTPIQPEEPTATPTPQKPFKPHGQSVDAALKKPLKVSSRNVLMGEVTQVVKGSVNTEVTLKIMHPVELTSIITTASAEALELSEGAIAYAVIKSSDVVIAIE